MAWITTKSSKKQAAATFVVVSPNDKYVMGTIKNAVKIWDITNEVRLIQEREIIIQIGI